jgi:NAD(P)-dependent dehydrogenase (short-subunit alcohol dehydrogenase family)
MTVNNSLGTVAWVTGAGKGIGRALAVRLADGGLTVAASARTTPDLDSLVAEADGRPGRIVAYPVDVTDEAAVARCADEIEAALGPIDLLVCNAGTHSPMGAQTFEAKTFRKLMRAAGGASLWCRRSLGIEDCQARQPTERPRRL